MMSTYQTQNSKLLWMIIGGISVVVVLFLQFNGFYHKKISNRQPQLHNQLPKKQLYPKQKQLLVQI
jgi:hypothetical protein